MKNFLDFAAEADHHERPIDTPDLTPLLDVIGDQLANWPVAATTPSAVAAAQTMHALEEIEADMLRYPQADIPVKHILLPGLYARIIEIPADCRLIGKIQRCPHLNVLLEGDITFMVDGVVRRVGPGWQSTIPGGTKKIGYAHKRTVWMTVHPNPDNETDTAALEQRIVANSYAEFIAAPVTGQQIGEAK